MLEKKNNARKLSKHIIKWGKNGKTMRLHVGRRKKGERRGWRERGGGNRVEGELEREPPPTSAPPCGGLGE